MVAKLCVCSGIPETIGFCYVIKTYFESLTLRVLDDQEFFVITRQQVAGFQYLNVMLPTLIAPGNTQLLALDNGKFVVTVQVAIYWCVVSHCCCGR